MRFILRFALWATPAFVIGWWLHRPYERWIGAVGAGLAAPPGTTIEVVDLELFFPFDLGIYVALCLASTWLPFVKRLRAAALGLPILVAVEIAALVCAFRVLIAGGGSPEALRLVNGMFRLEGLVMAAVVWLLLVGRKSLLDRAAAALRR